MKIFAYSLFFAITAAFNRPAAIGRIRSKSLATGTGEPFRNGCTRLQIARFFGGWQRTRDADDPALESSIYDYFVPTVDDATEGSKPIRCDSRVPMGDVDIVVVGGGVGGLAAAVTAAESLKKKKIKGAKIVLLEASSEVGGRVKSETTSDGFTLDHGFAVFIDSYPEARRLLDFEKLKLKPFLPGAVIKLKNQNRLARVADPLRVPGDMLNSLVAPVGSLSEKIDVLPLYLNVLVKSIEELFEERETDTQTALTERWGLSETIISRFFKPFLEGIYLAPLSQQSSRMLSFVLKMFAEGSATLPEGGMGSVSSQLAEKAQNLGVDIRTEIPVTRIENEKDGSFIVESLGRKRRFRSPAVVIATDGRIAQRVLSTIDGFENLSDLPEQPQRSVGCVYYSFEGKPPIEDPILVLNGIGDEAGSENFPVNNVCFPSVVNKGYAPEGYTLCSVTVLGDAMTAYEGRPKELDKAVRRQLGTWFRDQRDDILETWELKKIFYIQNAQPAQYKGPFPASVSGGRPTNTYRSKTLPSGLLVCGDHMATSSLNGALESGVAAGQNAATLTAKVIKSRT